MGPYSDVLPFCLFQGKRGIGNEEELHDAIACKGKKVVTTYNQVCSSVPFRNVMMVTKLLMKYCFSKEEEVESLFL